MDSYLRHSKQKSHVNSFRSSDMKLGSSEKTWTDVAELTEKKCMSDMTYRLRWTSISQFLHSSNSWITNIKLNFDTESKYIRAKGQLK